MSPKISVLMPNYNGEKYLKQAIESILNQTFTDFEFLIIDDGSSDSSMEIINSYSDDRIVLIKNEVNRGLPATLNIGLDIASGEYIARIDSDDIALPTRFEKQVKFMDENPQIGVCGTNCRLLSEDTVINEDDIFPMGHEFIKAILINDCSIHHPSVMLRTEVFRKNNLKYNENIKFGEDYEFWSRVVEYTKFATLQEVLIYKRIHSSQITIAKRQEQLAAANEVRLKMIKKILPDVTEEDFNLHKSLFLREFTPNSEFFKSVEKWFKKLTNANTQSGFYYDENALNAVLVSMWLQTLKASGSGVLIGLYYFMKAPFSPCLKIRILIEKVWEKISHISL